MGAIVQSAPKNGATPDVGHRGFLHAAPPSSRCGRAAIQPWRRRDCGGACRDYRPLCFSRNLDLSESARLERLLISIGKSLPVSATTKGQDYMRRSPQRILPILRYARPLRGDTIRLALDPEESSEPTLRGRHDASGHRTSMDHAPKCHLRLKRLSNSQKAPLDFCGRPLRAPCTKQQQCRGVRKWIPDWRMLPDWSFRSIQNGLAGVFTHDRCGATADGFGVALGVWSAMIDCC